MKLCLSAVYTCLISHSKVKAQCCSRLKAERLNYLFFTEIEFMSPFIMKAIPFASFSNTVYLSLEIHFFLLKISNNVVLVS